MMSTQPRAVTVPTYIHQFYAGKYAASASRFSDLPAFRSFVGYQVRLVNALLSKAKGFEVDQAATVISFNHYFVTADFDDLLELLRELANHGIVDARLTASAVVEIDALRAQFDRDKASFRRMFR